MSCKEVYCGQTGCANLSKRKHCNCTIDQWDVHLQDKGLAGTFNSTTNQITMFAPVNAAFSQNIFRVSPHACWTDLPMYCGRFFHSLHCEC